MNQINYRHLGYFRAVAHEGHLTRAAEKMNLSQSALSAQIKALEDQLGHALFERAGRQLVLTEVGRMALDYADRIFGTGAELLATLRRAGDTVPPLRVGAISTLSRNFQLEFLRPVLARGDVRIVLRSGGEESLLDDLRALALDVVLTTEPPAAAAEAGLIAHRISDRPVAIHGLPGRMVHASLADLLEAEPVIVPTESSIRVGFDALVARLQVQPRIVAEVDDMAMVRLLAREGTGLAIAPSVVFADEIRAGMLAVAPFDLKIEETFYAITVSRNFPHPVLDALISGTLPGAGPDGAR
ncbi:LysR family transcriptional regulator [Silicimonas sp. MF1-12-2]|uniref:LysR family transcriptional regulator n=1 Tax=Silicimonas sp. MF1-12-2 TaxID=3384793 RepID=UPI0039B4F771